MNLKIELTKAEEKGIKAYLKEVDGIVRPTKEDVRQFVMGECMGALHAPHSAVSDYVRQFENN